MNLYITATPIGNLEDMTFRAVRTLKEVDVVLCEDTRVTRKLMNHFLIETPLKAYHDFNKESVEDEIITAMKEGTVFALVSDAGMPIISDPGYELIRRMQDEGLTFQVIPGASALLSAVAASGIPSFEFSYMGFLPKSKSKKKEAIERLLQSHHTSVIYETPHDIRDTLKMIVKHDPSRELSISREISKKFEQHKRNNAQALLNMLDDSIPLKGEFVIVVAAHPDNEVLTFEMSVEDHVEMMIEKDYRIMDAIKEVAKIRGLKKQDVYDKFHKKNP